MKNPKFDAWRFSHLLNENIALEPPSLRSARYLLNERVVRKTDKKVGTVVAIELHDDVLFRYANIHFADESNRYSLFDLRDLFNFYVDANDTQNPITEGCLTTGKRISLALNRAGLTPTELEELANKGVVLMYRSGELEFTFEEYIPNNVNNRGIILKPTPNVNLATIFSFPNFELGLSPMDLALHFTAKDKSIKLFHEIR